jgi:hypothetical protein
MPAVCGYRDLGVRDQRHLFFLDTGLVREVTDFPTHLGLPVSSYPNLVLGLHPYTHGYTIDALMGQKPNQSPGYPWGGYDQSYSLGAREAKAMGAALFVAEFGNDQEWDTLIMTNELLQQEKHLVGFAFWTWKENGGSHSWGVYDPPKTSATPMPSSGCLRADRELLLARVYPRATADPGLSYHYDSNVGAFSLQAHGKPGDGPTIVYVPRIVKGEVITSGAATEAVTAEADGSRLVLVSPSGGAFSVTVGAAPLGLTACS